MYIDTRPIAKEKGASAEVELEGDARPIRDAEPGIEPQGPMHVHAKVTNIGSGFLLEGSVELPVRLQCTRCLGTFETSVNTEFSERFRRVGAGKDASGTRPQTETAGAVTLSDDDLWERGSEDAGDDEPAKNVFSGDRIQLDEFAREILLLAVPMKRLCSSECKGICPQCGKNRNVEACSCETDDVDPRLSRLADLLKQRGE